MKNQEKIIKIVAVAMALTTIGTLAACKKTSKNTKTTTKTSTTVEENYLDIHEKEETTVITDENGEEKTYVVDKSADGTTAIYEKVTDTDGKVVKGEDGKVVTKPYVAPVDGTTAQGSGNNTPVENSTTKAPATQPNTPAPTSPKTTTAPKPTAPKTTKAPVTKPPVTKPPVTNPPAVQKVTAAQRQALEDKMIRTAKEIGYTTAIRSLEDEALDAYSGDSESVTPSNYNEAMGDDRFGMAEYVKVNYTQHGKRTLILMWKETPEKWILYTYVE